MQTQHDNEQTILGYHALVRHIIELAFNDLTTWCSPYTEYSNRQRENLLHEFYRTELYELAAFFGRRAVDEPSGIEHLAGAIEMDINVGRIIATCRPLIREAMRQANLFRQSRGLEPYWQFSI